MPYATRRDLKDFGLPPQALAGLSARVILAHLEAASGRINSYIRGQETLPLQTPYPPEIVEATVILASYSLLVFRGYNPDEFSANFRERYLDMVGDGNAPGWLNRLSQGSVNLSTEADSTPGVQEGAPGFATGDPRGWDDPPIGGVADI